MAGFLAAATLAASLVAGQLAPEPARLGPPSVSPNAPASVPASVPASTPGSLPESQPGSSATGGPAGAGRPGAAAPGRPGEPAPGPAPDAGTSAGEVQSSVELLPILDLQLRANQREGSYWSPTVGTQLTSQLLVEPTIAFLVGRGTVTTRVAYVPRLQMIFTGPGEGAYANHRLFAEVDLRLAPVWTLAIRAGGSYGTQSFVGTAGTATGLPPGTAPPPTPVPSATSLEYWRAELLVQATGRLGPTTTLRLTGAATGQGGISLQSQLSMPPQVGPRLAAALEAAGSRLDIWTTEAYATGMHLWRTVPVETGFVSSERQSLVLGASESWRHRAGPLTELAFSLGFAYGSSGSTTVFSYDRWMPTGEVRVQHDVPLEPGVVPAAGEERRPLSRLQFTASVALAPYVDPYSAIVYDRLVGSAAVDWTLGANWRVAGYASGAMDILADNVPRRYGAANVVLGWSPSRYATFEVGMFAHAQNGVPGLVFAYSEWGGQLGVLLYDRLRL